MRALLALLFLVVALRAQDNSFQRGVEALNKGHFHEATDHLNASLRTAESDAQKASVHLGLGHCAHGLGNEAEALLHYLRARHFEQRDRELDELIGATRKRLHVGGDTPPTRQDELLQALQTIPGRALVAATLALVIIALGCGLYLRRFTSRYTVGPASLAAVGLVLLLSRALWSPPALGVFLSESVPLRTEPNPDASPALRMERGSTIWVEAASDRWVQVILPSGRFWVERAQIGLVAQHQP
jgi:hypothetical protein